MKYLKPYRIFESKYKLESLAQNFISDISKIYDLRFGESFDKNKANCAWFTKEFYNWAKSKQIDVKVVYFDSDVEAHIAPMIDGKVIDFTVKQFTKNPKDNYLISEPQDYKKFGYDKFEISNDLPNLETVFSADKINESVDLVVPNIDKYKPMIKLMADFLNLNVDERYNVSENEIPLQHIYSTLHKIEGLFNDRHIKIGDAKYSLSTEGDNELNKLKEIKKIHVGHGESITFNPDLYFEDLKFIDWLLYKVEQGDYHVKIDTQYWDYGKTYQLPSNYPKSFDDHLIKNFKEILKSIEDFYIKCKDIKLPNFTSEDIEDMLLEYLDNRTIQKLYVQGRFNKYPKISQDFIYTYQVDFILNIPNSIVSVTPDLEQWSADEATKIYKSCLSKFFDLMDDDLFVSNDWETKDYIASLNLKLVEK